MSDDLQAKRKEAAQRHKAERDRVRRAWAREGYRPKAHLEGIDGVGEIAVLLEFGRRERFCLDYPGHYSNERRITATLAMFDISEIVRNIRDRVRTS
jgi:hypothetical protein